MESLLQQFSFWIFVMAGTFLLGGALSLYVFYRDYKTVLSESHEPFWDKDLNVVQRHRSCLACEVIVSERGGFPESHSAME